MYLRFEPLLTIIWFEVIHTDSIWDILCKSWLSFHWSLLSAILSYSLFLITLIFLLITPNFSALSCSSNSTPNLISSNFPSLKTWSSIHSGSVFIYSFFSNFFNELHLYYCILTFSFDSSLKSSLVAKLKTPSWLIEYLVLSLST